MRKIIIISILLLYCFSYFVNAQDYLKIKYVYYPRPLVVEQGKSNSTFVVIQNMHTETLYDTFLKFQLPSGLEATQPAYGLEELLPNQRGSISFKITARSIANGTYNITLWAQSVSEIGNNYIQSPKYGLLVKVLKNTSAINDTTISTIITSTRASNTTTPKVSTSTINSNISVNQNNSSSQNDFKENFSNLPTYLKILAVAAFIVILIIIFSVLNR